MLNRHGSKEKKIFSLFAQDCVLAIRLDSIKKGEEPADISCEIEGEGYVAFQMVELIDKGLAQQTYGNHKLEKQLEHAYQSLSVNDRREIDRHLGDASVRIEFDSKVSLQAKKSSIPLILELLQKIDPSFKEGDIRPKSGSSLAKTVRKITIRRRDYNRPNFHVVRFLFLEDPILNRIREKLEKYKRKKLVVLENNNMYK